MQINNAQRFVFSSLLLVVALEFGLFSKFKKVWSLAFTPVATGGNSFGTFSNQTGGNSVGTFATTTPPNSSTPASITHRAVLTV